jgi:hypothetical protein
MDMRCRHPSVGIGSEMGVLPLGEDSMVRPAPSCRARARMLRYLIEVGQATGMLEGRFAKKRPEDLPTPVDPRAAGPEAAACVRR